MCSAAALKDAALTVLRGYFTIEGKFRSYELGLIMIFVYLTVTRTFSQNNSLKMVEQLHYLLFVIVSITKLCECEFIHVF